MASMYPKKRARDDSVKDQSIHPSGQVKRTGHAADQWYSEIGKFLKHIPANKLPQVGTVLQ